MIKRILIVLAVVLLPLTAVAAEVPDRDVLLTSDGTLYTVESVSADVLSGLQTPSQRLLLLTTQNGTTTSTTVVPASLSGGFNINPSLAYDPQSKTVFLFWQTALNGFLTSDLFVCSYQNGTWGTPTALDTVSWAVRENLHIALTRKTDATNADGTTTSIPEITVHAVWWQQDSSHEWARYAMVTMDSGNVSSIEIKDLSDFLQKPDAPVDNPVTNELMRHPVIFESTAHDTVDVVYGDMRSGNMHRVTIKPIANARVRIPVGIRDTPMRTPVANLDGANVGNVSALSSNSSDGFAMYFGTTDSVNYVLFKNGSWSPLRSIALTGKITRDNAIEALRRMISSE